MRSERTSLKRQISQNSSVGSYSNAGTAAAEPDTANDDDGDDVDAEDEAAKALCDEDEPRGARRRRRDG